MKGRANALVGAAVGVVLVSAILAFAFMQGAGAGGDLVAVVHDADGAAQRLPLSEDAECTVSTSLGTNVVVVEGGSVYVREADCDNQDCVHQGKLVAPGHQIICLPHKLWIEVVAEGGSSGQMDVGAVEGAGGGSGSGTGVSSSGEAGEEALDAVAR